MAAAGEAPTRRALASSEDGVSRAQTLRGLDVPPSQEMLGPWVQHLECAGAGPAAAVLAAQLGYPEVRAGI